MFKFMNTLCKLQRFPGCLYTYVATTNFSIKISVGSITYEERDISNQYPWAFPSVQRLMPGQFQAT
jgi:hypothetical protein